MEAIAQPETVWLLENQAVLDDLKSEADEFQETDVQSLRPSTCQNEVGIKEEAPISNDRNEYMKMEMDVEEDTILEKSSEYIPSHKRSGITGAQQCGEININTDKPDHTVTNRMKSHTGGKRLKCELCSKCFTQRSHLTVHIRTHTGDKPFKCEVCSKCFAARSNLNIHVRTHTRDKPFKCEVCSKCFTQRTILTDHIRTHTGDRPFKCEVCSKCFTQRSSLRDHIRSHTGDKPFKCDVCGRHFKKRSYLSRHIRTHTKD